MGNRGTTRSWDEEEIEKYGFAMHMSFTARHLRASLAKEKTKRDELIKQLVALLQGRVDRSVSISDCDICTKPIIDEHPDEVEMVEGKPVHKDCYFDQLGTIIEKHPVTSPRQS